MSSVNLDHPNVVTERECGVEQLIRFEEEWELARQYLETEKERAGVRFKFDARYSGDVTGHMIPPLTLQPLLENALRHGLAGLTFGGRVQVRARFHSNSSGPRWWMVVRDNGVGLMATENGAVRQRTGATYRGETLTNLRLRLEHLLEDGGLWIRPGNTGGTMVLLTGGAVREAGSSDFTSIHS